MVSLRGWARTSSTAAKLATVEQIIGYRFKSVERLYEALDLEKPIFKLPNGEQRQGKRTRNTRLALVGDSAAELNFACQWYDRDLTGYQWVMLRSQGLCNDTLGQIGFKLGLNELTVPGGCEGSYDMASTVEAILGAVHYDGGDEALRRVMTRIGVTHRLLDAPERAWVHEVVTSSRNLPEKFFAGRQWDLQGLLSRTNPSLLPRSATGGITRLPLNEAHLLLQAKEAESRAQELAEEQKKIAAKLKAEKEAELLKKKAEEEAELLKRQAEEEAELLKRKAEEEARLLKKKAEEEEALSAQQELLAIEAQERAREEEKDVAPRPIEETPQKEAERMAQEEAEWEEEEEADRKAQEEADREAQEDADWEAQLEAENRSEWETLYEAEWEALKEQERQQARQQSGVWGGMKQWWLGPDAVADSKPAAKFKAKTKSKKKAKSDNASQGKATWYETFTQLWHGTGTGTGTEQPPKPAKALKPLNKRQRKQELQRLQQRIKNIKKERRGLATGKKRRLHNGKGSPEYKLLLEEIDSRLMDAKQAYTNVQQSK